MSELNFGIIAIWCLSLTTVFNTICMPVQYFILYPYRLWNILVLYSQWKSWVLLDYWILNIKESHETTWMDFPRWVTRLDVIKMIIPLHVCSIQYCLSTCVWGLADASVGHQQQLYFPSETPRCSGRLWRLWRNLVPSDGESHAACRPGDGSNCILASITLRLVYAPAERHVCYTLCRGCIYAAPVHTTPGDVYAFLRPIATFYLFAIAIYRMPQLPHICLALRFCHILQYSLRFWYLTCRCICFAIILFYRSEIYSPICTVSSTMPTFLHILRWSIISLRCFVLLIGICILAILALITVDITGSQVKTPKFRRGPSSPAVVRMASQSSLS